MNHEGRRVGPNIGRLAVTLSEKLLSHLIDTQGCCIVYQHFGMLGHDPERSFLTSDLEFHPENLLALKRLKSKETAGQIWVPALAHFLDYAYRLNTLQFCVEAQPSPERLVIRASPNTGYEYRGVDGMSLQVTETTKHVTILTPDGAEIDAETTRDGDATWANVPVKRLSNPDWHALASDAGVSLSSEITTTPLDGSQPVSLTAPPRV